MVGGQVKIHGKLPGSTILEVVISMIIIILVFGTAMMIFTHVTQLTFSVKKLRAQAILQETLQRTTTTNDDRNEASLVDGFHIEQQLKPVENEPGLSQLILTAFDENQEQIAQVRQIIIKDHVAN